MKLPLNDEKRLMQGRWRVDEVPTGFCVTYTPNTATTPPTRLYSAKVLIARSICVTTSYLCQASPSWSVRFSVATLAVSLANWITRGAAKGIILTNFSSSRWNGFLTLIECSQRSHAQPARSTSTLCRCVALKTKSLARNHKPQSDASGNTPTPPRHERPMQHHSANPDYDARRRAYLAFACWVCSRPTAPRSGCSFR